MEDNLAAQRILIKEAAVQKRAVATSSLALRLGTADYKGGTVDFTSVLVAQTAAFTAQQNEVNVVGRQMTAAVGLITALGGGWDVSMLTNGD